MGIEGMENLTGEAPESVPVHDPARPERPTDLEIERRRSAERAIEMNEHNRRTGGYVAPEPAVDEDLSPNEQ
jgi:hypothetical protein